jgi:hypothetical protein
MALFFVILLRLMNEGQITINNIIEFIFDPAVLLIFSVGFMLFVWGLVQFISNPADTTKKEMGQKHMLWGIIGMFIMIAVGGIIALIDDTFDLRLSDTQNGGGFERQAPAQPGFSGSYIFDSE